MCGCRSARPPPLPHCHTTQWGGPCTLRFSPCTPDLPAPPDCPRRPPPSRFVSAAQQHDTTWDRVEDGERRTIGAGEQQTKPVLLASRLKRVVTLAMSGAGATAGACGMRLLNPPLVPASCGVCEEQPCLVKSAGAEGRKEEECLGAGLPRGGFGNALSDAWGASASLLRLLVQALDDDGRRCNAGHCAGHRAQSCRQQQ